LQEDKVTIGKIVKPFGVHGEVKIFPLTDYPERFQTLEEVMIQTKEEQLLRYRLSQVRLRPPFVFVVFEGIDCREDVDEIRGGLVQIPESERISLPKGEYFQSDLIGLEVYHDDDVYLGTITEVIETGANDLFVIKGGKREVLIPALRRIVKRIDLKQNRMEIDPPEGLLTL